MRAILTYHSIDSSGSVISVSPMVFERQLRWLASGPVDVVSLPELLRRSDDRHAIAITFDDAYTNFEREAWPRLKHFGLPATLFVPTGFVGKSNTWSEMPGGGMPRLSILGWAELARLHEQGVSLGAHTRSHPDLRTLDAGALEDDVRGSFDDLARNTGARPESFAYPYGFWSPAAATVARAAFRCACTTELRPLGAHEDRHLLPRLDTYYLRGPAVIENFGTVRFQQYLRLRRRLRTLMQALRQARPS